MAKDKTYSTVRVKNPSSVQHVVYLQPGQTLALELDEAVFPSPRVEISTSNLFVVPVIGSPERTEYLFVQAEEVAEWANYSTCHLGDIWIGSDKTTARLVVMLACRNPHKDRHVTAINPDCTDLRMRPHDVLEVILYDADFTTRDDWTWTWCPTSDVGLETLWYNRLSLSMWAWICDQEANDSPNHPYSRLPRIDTRADVQFRQHHFWFRFDERVLAAVDQCDGLCDVGTLKFFGWSDCLNKGNDPTVRSITLVLNLKDKHKNRDKIASTLSMVPRGDVRLDHTPLLSVLGQLRKSPPKPPVPLVRPTELTLLAYKSFAEGCNTMPAEPEPEPEPQAGVIRVFSRRPDGPVRRYYGGSLCGFEDYRGNPYEWVE
jgi:hypothetical protein